jgi:hypothetical protein
MPFGQALSVEAGWRLALMLFEQALRVEARLPIGCAARVTFLCSPKEK